ncbi:hypothetical protein, partial [Thermoleptolyngbya sp.]
MPVSANQGQNLRVFKSNNYLESFTAKQAPARSRIEIIRDIKRLVPAGSPEPEDEQILNQLAGLTQELTKVY